MRIKWNAETLTLEIDDLMFVGHKYGIEAVTNCFYKGGESPKYNLVDQLHVVFKTKPKNRDINRIALDIKNYLEHWHN